MKNSKALKTILISSGLVAAGIGASILFSPAAFYATYDIVLGNDVNLLNEIRAPGAALLAIGILIMSGAFVEKLTFTSIVVSTLVYLSYGLSRVMSIAIDGMPVEGLVQAAALEIIIGVVSIFAFIKFRKQQNVAV